MQNSALQEQRFKSENVVMVPERVTKKRAAEDSCYIITVFVLSTGYDRILLILCSVSWKF